jgi:hypothetical protein
LQVRVDYIGNDRAPVLVIEDVWNDPHSLVEAAAGKATPA